MAVSLISSGLESVIRGDDSDSDPMGPDIPVTEFDDDDQSIVAQSEEPTLVSLLEFLEDSGALSEAEAEAVLDETQFVEDPLNILAGGGDDLVVGGVQGDVIDAGTGNDLVIGGPGDDTISLGDGRDISGADIASDDLTSFGLTAEIIEGGDDFIKGGAGDDIIIDRFGANRLSGSLGRDIIDAVDADGVTPDTVLGGFGADQLWVDQGDSVLSGEGQDQITVDVTAGLVDGYQVVTLEDFDPSQDIISIQGRASSLVTVADLSDGSGADIALDGIPVLRVIGGQGLNPASVELV